MGHGRTRRHHLGLRVVLAAIFAIATLAVPAPANAGPLCEYLAYCGSIKHYSPDDGYDAGIIISCKWGNGLPVGGYTHTVLEGQSSKAYCGDMDAVYVRPDEEIWCKLTDIPAWGDLNWHKEFDAVGWHKTIDTWEDGYGCTVRRD